jgi:hypothetical protein
MGAEGADGGGRCRWCVHEFLGAGSATGGFGERFVLARNESHWPRERETTWTTSEA